MASSLLGSLLVEIKGDNSNLDKSIDKSEGSVKKFSKFAVASYALVGAAIVSVGNKMSKLAAEAEEVRSKFNVVFGRTAKDVKKWADTYSKSVGRSTTETLSFLGSIGDLLKPLGFQKEAVDNLSKTVVTLANDLGSFNDMPTADVMRDIQSAMVGNFEVTKKYGVVLNESIIKQEAFNRGLFDGKGVVDAQVKAQVALDLIIRGTNDAQGDLLRTQDSATNVSRRLEAANKDLGIALGNVVNKGLTPFKSITANLVGTLAEWIEKQNSVNKVLSELKTGAVDADTPLEVLQETYVKLNKNLQDSIKWSVGNQEQIKKDIVATKALIGIKQRQNYAARNNIVLTKEEIEQNRKKAEEDALAAQRAAKLLEERRIKEQEDFAIRDEYWSDFWSSRTAEMDLFKKALDERDEREKESAEKEIELQRLRLEASAIFFNGWSQLAELGAEKSLALAIAFKALASAEAFVNSWLAYTKVLASGIPFPFNKIAASGVVASGLAAQAKIIGQPIALAEGGVLAPASGGVPAVMAEAGVPEMAMPLNSSATDPFADKIASRISSTTTNNNTQNFNSMFSLNNERQLQEAARRLFPALVKEEQRRGI